MPVLVTGASGFLGGRLTQMLLAQGEEVVILARPASNLRHLPLDRLTVVQGDLSDMPALTHAVDRVDRIFHCAACSTDWATLLTYKTANIDGTKALLAAARQAPHLTRFVHVSTTDIYGYPLTPCSEDQPFHDAGLPYNQTKGAAEASVWNAHEEHGLPITIVRPATIYGPRGKDFTLEIAAMLRLRLMVTIDQGTTPGGFVYVDDVAQAMIDVSIAKTTIGRAYNIAAGDSTTWARYLQVFAKQLGTRRPWIDLSFASAMNLARLLEVPHRLLHLPGRPLLTQHAVYLLGRNQEFPIARAAADFAYQPQVTLEQGIRRSVAWLKTLPGT